MTHDVHTAAALIHAHTVRHIAPAAAQQARPLLHTVAAVLDHKRIGDPATVAAAVNAACGLPHDIHAAAACIGAHTMCHIT